MKRRITIVLAGVTALVALSAATVVAQAPPDPPQTFYGSVTGGSVGGGVVALVNGQSCGVGKIIESAGPKYVVDILSASQKPGCATAGATVRFYLTGVNGQAGKTVTTTGTWQGAAAGAEELNLTAGASLEVVARTPHISSDGPTY